jgi:hypothetical protein
MFWGTAIWFFTAAAPFFIPPTVHRLLLSLQPWWHLLFCCFDSGHTKGRKVYLTVVLIYRSLMMSDTELIFKCLLATCLSSWTIKVLCPFYFIYLLTYLLCWESSPGLCTLGKCYTNKLCLQPSLFIFRLDCSLVATFYFFMYSGY